MPRRGSKLAPSDNQIGGPIEASANADGSAEKVHFDEIKARADEDPNTSGHTPRFPAQESPRHQLGSSFPRVGALSDLLAKTRNDCSKILVSLKKAFSWAKAIPLLLSLVLLSPLGLVLCHLFGPLACNVPAMSLTPACSAGVLAQNLAVVEDQLRRYPFIVFHIGCFDEQKPQDHGPALAMFAAQSELGRLVDKSRVIGTDDIDPTDLFDVAGLFRTHEGILGAESRLNGSMDQPSLTELMRLSELLRMEYFQVDRSLGRFKHRLRSALLDTLSDSIYARRNIEAQESGFADQSAYARWQQTWMVAGHRTVVLKEYLTVAQRMRNTAMEALKEAEEFIGYLNFTKESWSRATQLREHAAGFLQAKIHHRKSAIMRFWDRATMKPWDRAHVNLDELDHGMEDTTAVLAQKTPVHPEFDDQARLLLSKLVTLCSDLADLEMRFQLEPMPINLNNSSWHVPHLSAAIENMEKAVSDKPRRDTSDPGLESERTGRM